MRHYEAAEILTSSWCPLNCKYCYIPKSQTMAKMHRQIIKDLKRGTFLNNLEKVTGKNLHYLGFWGTEPALTLNILKEKLPEIHKKFPELKEISFSTSMIMPEPIRDFAKALSKYNIELKVQDSLDGPAFITDKNRFKGAAKKNQENLFKLVSQLQNLPSKVEFRWKATLTIENIREMNQDSSKTKIDQYYNFFKNLNKKFNKINQNSNITLAEHSYVPTLAVPGKYTSEDGKDFAVFLKNLRGKGHCSTYFSRLQRLIQFQDELGTKKTMFTCSGGDSNIGMDFSDIHICHRSYYLNNDKYINSILEKKDIENWDISDFKKGSIDLMRENFIVDVSNEREKTRFNYIMRNYHDFWRMQISYVKAMMKELALTGQAEKRFLEDDDYSTLFALFVNTGLSCPMENILNTGSLYTTPLSFLRMFGNGAFSEILKEIIEEKRKPSLPVLNSAPFLRPSLRYIREWSRGRPLVGVEVGVFEGKNAYSMLKNIPNLNKLYLFDPYQQYPEYKDSWAPRVKEAKSIAIKRLGSSGDRIQWRFEKFEDTSIEEPLDFIYIDGNHAYEFVNKDLHLAEKMVKPGGIIAGHDYYEKSVFGVKRAVDEFCKERNLTSNIKDIDFWFINKKQNPKIYFYNLNVGSGIERAGNSWLSMLDQYKKEHPENVREYKTQNPPWLLIKDLIDFNPDVIIMNEYYPRVTEACYYFKKFKKDTKIILLNHCYEGLIHLESLSKDKNNLDRNNLVKEAFRDTIDRIINLNYHPQDKPYLGFLKDKVVDMFHTLKDEEWKIKAPFPKRKKDFLYTGNVLPHKLSREFMEKFSKRKMKLDIYGKMFQNREDLKQYNSKIKNNKNFNYLEHAKSEQMEDIYNQYRFLVIPHDGYEPFSFVLLEAMKCGTIPLVINQSKELAERGDWLAWADGLYLNFNSVDELLNEMKKYLRNKNNSNLINQYSKKSEFISREINKRTNYEQSKKTFLNMIFN